MQKLATALLVFLTCPLTAHAEERHYVITCDGVATAEPRSDAVVIKFKSQVTLVRVGDQAGYICSQALNSSPEQLKYRITAATTKVSLRAASGGNYSFYAVAERSPSEGLPFDGCDLRPAAGTGTKASQTGWLQAEYQRALCRGRGLCPHGPVSPSDDNYEIQNFSYNFSYTVDATGKMAMVNDGMNTVGIMRIDASGNSQGEVEYLLRRCQLQTSR